MCPAWLKREDFEQKSAEISFWRYLLRSDDSTLEIKVLCEQTRELTHDFDT